MRQHFSIGVGSELVTAFALQLFAQRRIIFDHAVVHKRDFSALVKVRMRVFVGHFSMSSPARVADAVLPRGRFFGHQFGKVRDPSGTLARLDLLPVYDGNTRGIVTAIFEPPQPVQEYGGSFCAADISDNSTHNFRREMIAYFPPIALHWTRRRTDASVIPSPEDGEGSHQRPTLSRSAMFPSVSQSAAHFGNVPSWARSLAVFAARDDDAVGGFTGTKILRAANPVCGHISAMQAPALPPGTTQRTLAIIMGGGAGTRLFPLTKDRAKPAVPLGGKYRLVDIPISNCLNSGLRSIYVLTQFNTMSLHRHIQASYKFDNFSRSFVDILAAQQTPEGSQWYQGTADAVRQNMRYFLEHPFEFYLILSGDQLYRMDFRALLHQHIRSSAEITLATKPVHRDEVSEFGIMQSGVDRQITRFVEKRADETALAEMRMSRELLYAIGSAEDEELFQASMGIYVFNRDVLIESLQNELFDFGKHIIPQSIKDRNVSAFIFEGYWEDIGTIRAFYEANLDLTDLVPEYSFFDTEAPIYTHPRFLPGSKINGATLRQSIISDGCIISDAHLERCVVGIRSVIQSGATIRNSIVMGADYFELGQTDSSQPPIGIGRNCVIDRAIIDKNARISDGVVITPEGKPANLDGDNYFIRDGIVVIPKNAVIPAGFWI